MKQNIIKLSLLLQFLCLSVTAFAATGDLFQLATTNYTVGVNTTIPNHTYGKASIRINTPGYTAYCPASQRNLTRGNCLFSTSDTDTTYFSIIGPTGTVNITLCLNGEASLSCQQYDVPIEALAYVVNFDNQFGTQGGSISTCPVTPNRTLKTCTTFTDPSFYGPLNLDFNTAGTLAYVASFNNNTSEGVISICPVNQRNGTLESPCTSFTGVGAHATGITLNDANTYAYVSTGGGANSVYICPILSNGLLGTCTSTTGNGTFVNTQMVVLNPENTYAYVGNANTTMSICPVNQANGSLGVCTTSTGNGTFQTPSGMRFREAGTVGYSANNGSTTATSTVSICATNPETGAIGACNVSDGNGTFDFVAAGQTQIFTTSFYPFLWVPNTTTNTLSMCSILSDNSLSGCIANASATFSFPSGVMVR